MNTIWGIDLGGTKIEGVILSAASPDAVLIRKRIDTEAHLGYRHIVAQIQRLVQELSAQTGYRAEQIGIATPGTLNPSTQTMKNSNTVCLNGMPLKVDLENALKIPVKMANDANCFALAEATMGIIPDVVPNFQCVFGVIMGTGVGGGVVFKGKDGQPVVLNGLQGIGGEWGHNVLEHNGYECYCGKRGCTEQVLSGPALQRYYHQISGQKLNLKEIIVRFKEDSDPHATQTVERMLDFFGQGISTLINVLDPDAIVLGGGVGNIDLLYTEGIEHIKKYIFNSKIVETPILRPKLGDSAGVFGAAMLVC
ncbi:MAG: ROK family protein [Runella slithyformis]|nr:MAG: ROK family protein [Runella slithyformis]TAF96454.1 MAG: ROK family protein [Runella sp.]TAG18442.1 MAG: ROK family protein [Cytophagales bacterium]TAG39737.1 MAG: ROK family protein [Cytophagia bacterium]TAE95356.1 MAG: ROK family protein [Runella slithyformis]